MKLLQNGLDWTLALNGQTILESSAQAPLVYVGCGQESVDMYRGNFKIEDYVTERRPLRTTAVTQTA